MIRGVVLMGMGADAPLEMFEIFKGLKRPFRRSNDRKRKQFLSMKYS